jgi:hypothetical protein
LTFTTIRGTGGAADTFAGSNGVDNISFVNQTNAFLLYGAQANDTVAVAAAFQGALTGTLSGGQGNDTYNLGIGNAFVGSLNGNEGQDVLTVGTLSTGFLEGGQDNDTITAATSVVGASSINGNKGSDTITIGTFDTAGTGAIVGSTIRGGQADDRITLTGRTSSLSESSIYGDDGGDVIVSTTTANYASSTIFGGNGEDTITEAGNFNAAISGDAGNDRITSAGGIDSLWGGEGNDTITGAGLGDQINVGGGTDVINYTAAADTAAATATFAANVGGIASGTLAGQALTNVDVVTGFGAGDIYTLLGTAASNGGYTTATATAGNNNFLNTINVVGLNSDVGNVITDNGASLIRGNWSASTNTWTRSTTGSDVMLAYDTDGTNTAGAFTNVAVRSIILSGAGGVLTNASAIAFSGGNVQINLV